VLSHCALRSFVSLYASRRVARAGTGGLGRPIGDRADWATTNRARRAFLDRLGGRRGINHGLPNPRGGVFSRLRVP